MTSDDHAFMRSALQLAHENVEQGRGGPFGAVIVRGDEIIGRGSNLVTSTNDPTAHAEMVAIRDACRTIGNFSLAGCRIYTSCEPCPMCLAAVYWARLDKIFFANTRHDAAQIGFDDDLIYREMNLAHGERSTPIVSLPSPEALETFALWASKIDKTPY